MKRISYSDLCRNLERHVERVWTDRVPLKITRKGHRSLLVIPEEDYEGLKETIHLMSSPENHARLLAAIKDMDEGRGIEFDPRIEEGSPLDRIKEKP